MNAAEHRLLRRVERVQSDMRDIINALEAVEADAFTRGMRVAYEDAVDRLAEVFVAHDGGE